MSDKVTTSPCNCQLCSMYYGDQAPTQEELKIAGYQMEIKLVRQVNGQLQAKVKELETELKRLDDERAGGSWP